LLKVCLQAYNDATIYSLDESLNPTLIQYFAFVEETPWSSRNPTQWLKV